MVRRKNSGFTLVDIIIAIAIFAIAASIALPGFLSMMPKWRLNGAARQIMGDLMRARMEAVEKNTSVTVSRVNDHEYKRGTAPPRSIHSDYHDVTISNFTSITFSSRGTPTTSPPNLISLSSSNWDDTKEITVGISGMVKID